MAARAGRDIADVRARQEAVRELQPLLDLREDLALLGDEVGAGGHPDLLTRWGGAPPLDRGALAPVGRRDPGRLRHA